MAIIRLVEATMPQRAMAAWDGAPHKRATASLTAGLEMAAPRSGVSSARASQGMAATPPASIRAIDRYPRIGNPCSAGANAAPAAAASIVKAGQRRGRLDGSEASPRFFSATAGCAPAAARAGDRLPARATARPSPPNTAAAPGAKASCGVAPRK